MVVIYMNEQKLVLELEKNTSGPSLAKGASNPRPYAEVMLDGNGTPVGGKGGVSGDCDC